MCKKASRTWMVLSAALLFIHSSLFPGHAGAQGIPYIKNFPASSYHAHNHNFDVITGNDGTVYVANFEGLLYYDNADWRIIHTPGITRITSVFRSSKNIIWTGGYNYIGYVSVDEQGRLQLHSINFKNTFQGEVQWIWEKDGHIFFKVSDDKIYTVINDNVQWAAGATLPTSGFSVFSDTGHINQVQELEGGIKALATNGNGIIFVDDNGKELFRITEENGLCSDNVNHITYDKNGMIWGATDNGIFVIAYPSIYTHFTQNEGLRGEVLSLAKMGQQLYAGTLSGAYIKQGMKFVQLKEITHACWQLEHDGSSLLAATSEGIFRIEANGKIKQLTTANTLSILADRQGFYSGEMEGVYYNGEEGRKKVSDIEKVVKIVRDKIGTIWIQNLYGRIWKAFEPYSNNKDNNTNIIATLVKYNGDVLPIFTNTQEPFTFPMYSYTDPTGVLWLDDNKGKNIYAFKNGSKNEELSSIVYPLMDYSVRAMLRDGDLMFLGGDKGINIVDFTHNDPTARPQKPNLLIRSILLRGDSVLWGGYGKQITKLKPLSSDDHHVTIRYSIDHPSLLLEAQYRVRMNGGKWSAWDNETYEEFSNLEHGNYIFEVQARDAFGRESDIVVVNFSIAPPFYLRWYMIIFYLLLFAVLVYQFMQWRLKQLEKEKRHLENIVQERTAEVVKQKDEIEEKSKNLENALHELGEAQHELVRQEKMATVGKLTQGLIDRILNPLNYINNFAKLSQGLVNDVTANIEDEKENMDSENYEDTMDVLDMLKGNLEKVGEHGANTSRTLKAMEEMLKDRSGGIVKMSLTALLHQDEEMVHKYYEKEIAEYGIKTVFDIPSEEVTINGNAEQLSKTFMSMLSNAIYAVIKKMKRQRGNFTPEIKMIAELHDKKVHLKFYDNGIGIEKNIIDKIFDPFFTTKTTSEASGVGLYLSREIAQNHNGDISVQSEKNVYTEFTITLPTL